MKLEKKLKGVLRGLDYSEEDIWVAGNDNLGEFSSTPMVSLYCYMVKQEHLIAVHTPINSLSELFKTCSKKVPKKNRDADSMLAVTAKVALDSFNDPSRKNNILVGNCLGLTLFFSEIGKNYMSKNPDELFDFILLLYPSTPEASDFHPRLAIMPRGDSGILDPDFAQHFIDILVLRDAFTKKEFFRGDPDWAKGVIVNLALKEKKNILSSSVLGVK